MKLRMTTNQMLEIGTYQIVCSQCGLVFYGPVQGDITEAALKAMELNIDGVCQRCGGEVIIEINPKNIPNKYSKDHPYYS